MKTIKGLTELENKVLDYLCKELAPWREGEPGYSCIGGSDITKDFKWNPKITSGVVSSLTKKGYVMADEEFDDTLYPNWKKIPDDFGRVPKVYSPNDVVTISADRSVRIDGKATLTKRRKDLDVEWAELDGLDYEVWEAELKNEGTVLLSRNLNCTADSEFTIEPDFNSLDEEKETPEDKQYKEDLDEEQEAFNREAGY